MNFLSLCLMTVLLASFCDGDLVISDFERGRHWLVTDDLKLLVTFDAKSDDKRILQLKARKSDDGIVTYIVHEEEIKMFNILKDGKISESGTIALNRKIGPAAPRFAFDVHPSGKYVVMSSEKELYFFSQKEKKLNKLLESEHFIRDVLIHPTKRTVYYSTCSSNNVFKFLFVYDIEAKVGNPIQIPMCFGRIFLDLKENVIWASTYGGILRLNLTNGVTESIFNIPFDEFVSSSDNLLIKYTDHNQNEQITSFWKLSKKHQVHKQTTLKDYNIQPALSHFKGSTPVLFDIDEGLIEILDDQFAKTNDKIKLDIAKKPIKSLRSISDDHSTTFFWIHDSNGGVVEYVQISHKDKAIIKRGTFKFQTGGSEFSLNFQNLNSSEVLVCLAFSNSDDIIHGCGTAVKKRNGFNLRVQVTQEEIVGEALEDLTDFDVFENKFYLSNNRGLLNADINYDKHDQSAKLHDENYGLPIVAFDIQKEQRKLVIFDCTHYLAGNVERPFDIKNSSRHTLTSCPEKILLDQEAEGILVSTSTGLFNFRSWNDYELIYKEGDLRNFVLDKGFVYFVSKFDGPSIYKVAKRRTVKLDHDLHIRKNGLIRFTNVKEFVEIDDNNDGQGGHSKDDVKDDKERNSKDDVKDDKGGNSKDDVKDDKGGNSKDDVKDDKGETSKDDVKDAEGGKPKGDKGAASETASPEQMILLLLVHFAMHFMP